ncbi:hypothetical protein [uncultured Jannaschia sp.]|uniref:hypothetical protein n=1 Tax=uncultured Jannaschia sp. TaxID=293347 RepID=UPI00262563AF|nr:hypothetical protein [uncultured Jannaschia sp.]
MRQRDPVGGHNERVKLLGSSINAIGLAFIALGVVRPIVDATVSLDLNSLIYLVGALALHGLAHYIVSQVEIDK